MKSTEDAVASDSERSVARKHTRPGELGKPVTATAGALADRVILITGAGGMGIGRGLVDTARHAGAQVVAVDQSALGLEELRETYPDILTIEADITDERAVQAAVDEAARECGRVDGLVNNAGVGLIKPYWDVEIAEFDRVYSIDVRGAWLVSRAVSRLAIDNGRPASIVNISSVHARASSIGYTVYASAKAAMDGLTRGIAIDGGKYGIRCNGIAPGYVDSAQNVDFIRGLTPDPEAWLKQQSDDFQVLPHIIDRSDCGDAAVYFLSDASRSVTGQIIAVDAGLTAQLYSNAFIGHKE